MNELAATFGTFPSMASFSPAELDALSRAMSVDEHESGHVFIREGDAPRISDGAYVLLSGEVRVTRTADAKALEKLLGPGELFGLIALVDRGERTASCIAKGPVKTAFLGRAAFDHLIRSNASLGWKFQLLVAKQLGRDWERLQGILRAALG